MRKDPIAQHGIVVLESLEKFIEIFEGYCIVFSRGEEEISAQVCFISFKAGAVKEFNAAEEHSMLCVPFDQAGHQDLLWISRKVTLVVVGAPESAKTVESILKLKEFGSQKSLVLIPKKDSSPFESFMKRSVLKGNKSKKKRRRKKFVLKKEDENVHEVCFKAAIPKCISAASWNSNTTTFYRIDIIFDDVMCEFIDEPCVMEGIRFKSVPGWTILTTNRTNLKNALVTCFLPPSSKMSKLFFTESQIELSPEKIRRIEDFQSPFFMIMLNKGPGLQVYQLGESEKRYLLAPTRFDRSTKNNSIDWGFIEKMASTVIDPFKMRFIEQLVLRNYNVALSEYAKTLDDDIVLTRPIEDYPQMDLINAFMRNMILQHEHSSCWFHGKHLMHEESPKSYFKRGKTSVTYVDHYRHKYGIVLKHIDQPLLRVTMTRSVNLFASFILKSEDKETTHPTVLVPEMSIVHFLSVRHLRSAHLLPSLLHRFEGLLSAEEIKKRLQLPEHVKHERVLESITHRSAFECFDYERLETLGDRFLKVATAVNVFLQHQEDGEGDLTRRQQAILTNEYLAGKADKLDILSYIRVDAFDEKIPFWYPPSMRPFVMGRKVPSKDLLHTLSETMMNVKCLADIIEALIGVCALEGGVAEAERFLQRIGVIEKNCFVYFTGKGIEENRNIQVNVSPNGRELERRIGYTFENPNLIEDALAVSGARFQRLEFLGDAILDWIVCLNLYCEFSGLDSGMMTYVREAFICHETLCAFTFDMGLHELVDVSDELKETLANCAVEYKKVVQAKGVRFHHISCPKFASDLYEAVLGAVAVDCKFNMGIIIKVIAPHLREFHLNIVNDPSQWLGIDFKAQKPIPCNEFSRALNHLLYVRDGTEESESHTPRRTFVSQSGTWPSCCSLF